MPDLGRMCIWIDIEHIEPVLMIPRLNNGFPPAVCVLEELHLCARCEDLPTYGTGSADYWKVLNNCQLLSFDLVLNRLRKNAHWGWRMDGLRGHDWLLLDHKLPVHWFLDLHMSGVLF